MAENILFIDDEPEFSAPHVATLQEAGYNVTSVYGPDEALAKLRAEPYDLVILDLILPYPEDEALAEKVGPSIEVGIAVYKTMREDRKLAHIPVVFFTVFASLSTREQIRQAGLKVNENTPILVKPVLPSELLSTVRRILGGS